MIETTENKVSYVVAADPVFAFPYPFFEPGNIHCYLFDPETTDETELVRGTDFSVQVKSDYSDGANITLLGTLVPGRKLTIAREMPLTQDVNLPEYGKLPTNALELQLDKFIMICQQLREIAARSFAVPHGMEDYDNKEIYNAFHELVTNAESWAEQAQAGAATAVEKAGVSVEAANTSVDSMNNAIAAADSANSSATAAAGDASDIRTLAEEATLNSVQMVYGDWDQDYSSFLSYGEWTAASTIYGAGAQIAEHNTDPESHGTAINAAKDSAIGTAASALSSHNSNASAHSSIRSAVSSAQSTANSAQTTANLAKSTADAALVSTVTDVTGIRWGRQWPDKWIIYSFSKHITSINEEVILPIKMGHTGYYIAANPTKSAYRANCFSKTTTKFTVWVGLTTTFAEATVEFLVVGKTA